MIVILMGVSGSGKSTIGVVLAERAGAVFADADDFHSVTNKQKMAAGEALTDADREPWLVALNTLLRGWCSTGQAGILACSALKQSYRETLSASMPPSALDFVLLDAPRALIAARLATRHHEFMTGALLDSQIRTLEPPDEAIRVINDRPPAVVAAEISSRLHSR